ncbi:MAG: flavin-containing monooxygenase [Candidatus Limnocylindrales bacterium]
MLESPNNHDPADQMDRRFERTEMTSPATERHDVIVVGAGQAGLATSHHLARKGIEHVVLEAGTRAGDAWRDRWDSLRLFTPAGIDGLPGMPFPHPATGLPTKDQMADYLTEYAEREHTPIEHGVRVHGLDRSAVGLTLAAGTRRFETSEIVVATGFLSAPFVPPFATKLDPAIRQLHSAAYRNPGSTPGASVLVVGGGNSGVEIALELARAGRRVSLAGKSTFLPRAARVGNGRPFFAFARRALTLDTPIGRRMRDRMGGHGSAPVIRVRQSDLDGAGVHRVARVEGARDGRPALADGRTLEVDSVVWCTGFRPAYDWIRLPVLEPGGLPRHERGVVASEPGLSFVGLPFQTGFLSPLVIGVGADAAEVVDGIATRIAGRRAGATTATPVRVAKAGTN